MHFKGMLYIFCLIFFLTGADNFLSAEEEVFSTGLRIESQDELDAAETNFNPMVRAGSEKLPSKVDLSGKMPPVGSQGHQGSCTAWSTTYYTKSYHERIKNKWEYGWGNYNPYYSSGKIDSSKGTHVFSPAWTYNQINGGRDSGSSIAGAFRLISQKGAVPWSVMPYNHDDYRTQPTNSMKKLALSKYKAKSYSRVVTTDPDNVKREIAAGNPVVGGFSVTSKWKSPSEDVRNGGVHDDYSGTVTGGHAMAVVGYDDSKVSPSGHKGAFRIINSWGNYWGEKGYFWMSYKCFTMLCKYAYVLYDSDASSVEPDKADKTAVKATSMVTATKGTYSDRVNVTWNSVDGAVSYIVEKSVGNSGSFARTALVNTNSYSDLKIQPDYRYNYRIVTVALNNRSKGESSPVAEGFALQKKSSLPGKVADLTGSASSGSSVTLKWTKVQNAKLYRVVRYNQSRRSWTTVAMTKNISFTDNRPLKSLPNYYYVAAVNGVGQGKWSSLVKISITAAAGPPAVVSGMTVSNGTYSDRIVVKWKKQSAASSYRLYRWNSSSRKWDKNWTVRGNSYTDRDRKVRGGSKFYYTAKAVNSRGSSKSWSSYVAGYTGRNVSMNLRSSMGVSAPAGFSASVDENSRTVTLSWKRLSMLAKYKVYRKKDSDEEFKLIKTLSAGTTSFSEKFPGEDGDIFMYNITANVVGSESEKTETLSATIEEFSPTVMTTFLPGDGLKNFRGIWRASHLKTNGKAVNMELNIVDEGAKFKVQMKYGNKKREITGNYAAKSRYLEAKNFSFMMLPAFDNDVANVVIPAGVFTRSRIVINFARENQD